MLTYTRTQWVNGSGSPLNATNLNNIETGIGELVEAVNTLQGSVEAHGTEISALKTVDATNATAISSNTQNITKLNETLTATNKTVGDNTADISVLQNTVGDATKGLVKKVNDLDTSKATVAGLNGALGRITDLETNSATKNQLTAVETSLDTKITNVDTTLKKRIADAEQDIITLQNSGGSGGGGASTWDELSGKPSSFNPTSHTSGDTTFGVGTTSLYGHVKISNADVNNTPSADGLVAGMDHTHSNYATMAEASSSSAGLMSPSDKVKLEGIDKAKLDGIESGATKTTVVNNLTSDSTSAALSAAQGKALKTAIDSLTGDLGELGGGDMLKASYDTDNNGYVDTADNAIKFDGHSVKEFSLDGHKHEIASVTGLQTELNNKSDKEHTHNYASQAFKSVKIGGTTITADDYQDTLEIVAGSNITLTGDSSNDKFTIAAKDTTYSFSNKAATLAWSTTSTIATVGGVDITVKMPANPNSDSDTKTTTGAGNTSSKIYLVGALAQETSPTTYTHDTAYVGTDGCLYSGGSKVLTSHQAVSNSAPTLSWGATSTIGTIGGTALTVKMPNNPNTNTAHDHVAGDGITLTGSGGTSGTTTIALEELESVEGGYGLNESLTLAHSGKFNVPYIVTDKHGRVTFATSTELTLPGDNNSAHAHVAGDGISLSGSGGTSGTTTISLAAVGTGTASYGPSANASPAHSGTFSVPYITVDKYGRVTSASTKTITLPKDNNTTYSAGTGISISSTTISNSGVRSITVSDSGDTITVNTNGSTATYSLLPTWDEF